MKTQPLSHQHASGEMLRTIRRTLGLSIADVATRTGISKSSLSLYETGQRVIENGKLLRVIAAYSGELLARTEGAR